MLLQMAASVRFSRNGVPDLTKYSLTIRDRHLRILRGVLVLDTLALRITSKYLGFLLGGLRDSFPGKLLSDTRHATRDFDHKKLQFTS